MSNIKVSCYTTIIVLFFSTVISAQQNTSKRIKLTGLVTNVSGSPIKNVIIFVDSIRIKEKTNRKGQYKIKVTEQNKTITFYHYNLGIYDVKYNGQGKLDFSFPMKSNKIITEEYVVNLGYSKPRQLIGSSGEVNFENDPTVVGYSSIFQLLRVRFPGVSVVGETISIRGSANSSVSDRVSKEPLYEVDGSIVSSIVSIAPNTVKSIRILKSSESGLYGIRGANGVVKIKLKK